MAERKMEKDQDNQTTLKILKVAKYELDRSRELGYGNKENEKEYAALDEMLKKLRDKIEKNESSPSEFESLKNRMKAFLGHFKKERQQPATTTTTK